MTTHAAAKIGSLEALRTQLNAEPEVEVDRFKDVDASTVSDDFLVCHCADVTAGELRGLIHSGAADSLDEVQRCTRAGGGCGKCVPLLTELVTIELSKVTVHHDA